MRKFAVIVAGGSGSRMGSGIPKQFLAAGGVPVIIHTLRAFLEAYADISLVIVLPAEHMDTGRELVAAHTPSASIQFTTGGKTRFDSVKNGLACTAPGSVIFVHDAVRCLVSPALIRRCYEAAMANGSAIPVVAVKDSIRRITGTGSEVVDREQLRAVQTPQVFRAEILLHAFERDYTEGFTDEATVVEASGIAVHLVEGEESNIKITYPSDLLLAEQFFQCR